MPDNLHLDYEELESGDHVITSPDVRGLYVVAPSKAKAYEEAERVLSIFKKRGVKIQPREAYQRQHTL